jgi:hypothetical protein
MVKLERTGAITTDSSGDATATIALPPGRVIAIAYFKTDYANGVDFDIQSGMGDELWDEDNVNAAQVQYPRVTVQGGTGSDVTYDGSNAIYEAPVSYGSAAITVASGGDTKSGEFAFFIET